MSRDAMLGARLMLVVLGAAVASACVLVLIGAPSGAGLGDVVRATVLAVGAGFGGGVSTRWGGATASAAGVPMLFALLAATAAWGTLRRTPVGPGAAAVAAVVGGGIVSAAVSAANGWHGLTVQAAGAGVGCAAVVAGSGAAIWAAHRWPSVRRPVDLLVLAALGLLTTGLAVEVIVGLSHTGGGRSIVPLHTEIALAIAYAPNAGVAAVALGLGGKIAVTGVSPDYFTFVARFLGADTTGMFGVAHGQSAWARTLHLPGLAAVVVLGPLLVLSIGVSSRWLRGRTELLLWAAGLVASSVVLDALIGVHAAIDYDGFVLGGVADFDAWGRLAGLVALPVGLVVFVLTGSTGEPGLDVGDRPRETSREVP